MRQEQIEIPVSLFLYEFIVFYKKYIIKSLLIIKNSIKNYKNYTKYNSFIHRLHKTIENDEIKS